MTKDNFDVLSAFSTKETDLVIVGPTTRYQLIDLLNAGRNVNYQ